MKNIIYNLIWIIILIMVIYLLIFGFNLLIETIKYIITNGVLKVNLKDILLWRC